MGLPSVAVPCAHADVCENAFTGPSGVCLLHDPDPGKSPGPFEIALSAHLDRGRCSLAYLHPPNSLNALNLQGRTFHERLVVEHVHPAKPIELQGATLKEGATFSHDHNLSLNGVVSDGPIFIGSGTGAPLTIHLDSGTFQEEVVVSLPKSLVHVSASYAHFAKRLKVTAPTIGTLARRWCCRGRAPQPGLAGAG